MNFLLIARIVFSVVYILQMVSLGIYLSSLYSPAMGALVSVQCVGLLLWFVLIICSRRSGDRKKLMKHIWIVWMLYAVGFVISVVTIFSQKIKKLQKLDDESTFNHSLTEPFNATRHIGHESTFPYPDVLNLTLCLTPVLLVLLISTTVSVKKNPKLIERLSITIAVDLFDGIEMLEVLIYQGKGFDIPKDMMVAILVFASLCFLVSSLALYEHKFKFRVPYYLTITGEVKNRRRTTRLRAGIQILCVNFIFLILRGVLWGKYEFSAPIFITKNVLCIASCIIDIIAVRKNNDTIEEFVV